MLALPFGPEQTSDRSSIPVWILLADTLTHPKSGAVSTVVVAALASVLESKASGTLAVHDAITRLKKVDTITPRYMVTYV